MKPVAYFLCALALVLICVSPLLILSYYEKLPERESFAGILSLWHISDWRTGGSSAAAFLEKRILEYEAKNPHVFIDLVRLSADEAAGALAAGRRPDMISYPYGAAPALETVSLPPLENCLYALPDAAYPYMSGGYCLLLNTDMLGENGIAIPEDWGVRPDKLLEAAQLGVCFDAESGYSALPALALHAYPPASRPNISTFGEPEAPDAALGVTAAWQDGLELFCKGEAGVLIASHRQLFEARLRYEQGDAPAFTACAIGGYTDMIQMIGVGVSENKPRQTAGEEFAALLLSERVQAKLEALGVFPTVGGLDIYRDDACRRAVYAQLCENAAPGEPDEQPALDSLARDAFGGDEAALKKLRQRLRSP